MDGNTKKIGVMMGGAMILTAIIFYLIGLIPIVNIISGVVEWGIFFTWYYLLGVKPLKNKKVLGSSLVGLIIAELPLIDMIPGSIISVISNIYFINKDAKKNLELKQAEDARLTESDVEYNYQENEEVESSSYSNISSEVSSGAEYSDNGAVSSEKRAGKKIDPTKRYTPKETLEEADRRESIEKQRRADRGESSKEFPSDEARNELYKKNAAVAEREKNIDTIEKQTGRRDDGGNEQKFIEGKPMSRYERMRKQAEQYSLRAGARRLEVMAMRDQKSSSANNRINELKNKGNKNILDLQESHNDNYLDN